ncbi:acetylornithine transaminase [Corynebacterium sp. 13CS0277]|uniref:acetylornithine transaminase n=1 Tax=Corynebacterium sp. 13CS0277 TaxID=2071994 RepID=UPI000D03A0CD|nr:acetylornithine transaminase [Corynebacterium sp. 13CS0277]PRQ11185.1 acetylornithine transaminase [Corynebacterium sp. 13CS0277]
MTTPATPTAAALADAGLASRWSHSLMDNYGTPPVAIVRGHGSTLVDEQGRVMLDMLAGIAVNSLGYGHPEVVKAVSEQVANFAHTSNLFATAPAVMVAEKLRQRLIPQDPEARAEVKVFFCNSGAEANEAAFKLARLTGRGRILAAEHGFHGRTMGSLAMTGQPDKREPFAPLPGGVEFYPYGDAEALRALALQAPGEVAAIILEPIQGETGVVPAPEGFLRAVRELCDEIGALMIVDEVQTGAGRTGEFFAHAHEGVLPDVVTMAKGLGAGLPIGAVVARGEAARLFTPGSHGTTFGGNPVACAAANVVLDHLDEECLAAIRLKGQRLAAGVSALPGVDHVRGRGLMLGVVLERPIAKQIVAAGYDAGIILNAPNERVLRLTPPLVISAQEIDEAIRILGELIAAHAG